MPASNEAGSIGAVLRELHSTPVGEIVVVDGGSTAGTHDIAREHGARVVSAQPGYGRACATGAAAATGEVLVFLDADGADAPADLPRLVAPISSGYADFVLGSRLFGRLEPGAMPPCRAVENKRHRTRHGAGRVLHRRHDAALRDNAGSCRARRTLPATRNLMTRSLFEDARVLRAWNTDDDALPRIA
ncbi:MAG: glycosyltransferase [Anaerolineales bacterium]